MILPLIKSGDHILLGIDINISALSEYVRILGSDVVVYRLRKDFSDNRTDDIMSIIRDNIQEESKHD